MGRQHALAHMHGMMCGKLKIKCMYVVQYFEVRKIKEDSEDSIVLPPAF